MQFRQSISSVGAIALAMVLSACDSSDNSSGSPNLDTGLEDKTLSSLSQGEVDQLNQAIGDYMASAVSKADMCKMTGVMTAAMAGSMGGGSTDAELQKACTDMEKTCNSSSASSETSSSPTVTTAQLANCTATVAELETCMKDNMAAMNAMMKSIPACSSLTASMLNSTTETPTTENPASCTALQTKCPNVPTSSTTSG